jgi:hypothetical protein
MYILLIDAFHISRPLIKRSFSDGNILCENKASVSDCNAVEDNAANSELLPMQQLDDIREPTDSAPEIYMCETNPCSRCVNPRSLYISGNSLFRIGPRDQLAHGY